MKSDTFLQSQNLDILCDSNVNQKLVLTITYYYFLTIKSDTLFLRYYYTVQVKKLSTC